MSSTGRYPGFHAPQGDGEILCVPPETELPTLLSRNRVRPELASVKWFGQPLAEIAHSARQSVLQAAIAHTSSYADVRALPTPDAPLIVTGHQAELFHPGVWLKNFAAAKLAQECGGTAINLIVDSDLCRATAIRVPTGAGADFHVDVVPFDMSLSELPFEERRIGDDSLWASFGTRVTATLHRSVAEPLIDVWWPKVIEAGHEEANLGLALSQARHRREQDWGAYTLEIPQSRICRTDAFRLFALQLCLQAREFRDAHNQALIEYRAAHKLTNHAQPVPNLTAKDDWIEVPFWLWSTSHPHRRGVYVRRVGEELVLSDLVDHTLSLPVEPGLALDQLSAWESQGIKLRTRALGTTLFARLLLADLFLHGIGGAKYDQVTDHICELFLGFALPQYGVVSGTLRLPLPSVGAGSSSELELRQEIRNLRFHPERSREHMKVPAGQTGDVENVIAYKRKWFKTPKTPENAGERHRAISQANEQLHSYLVDRKAALELAITQARFDAAVAQLKNSREYAYCLFPERQLRAFFRV